MKIGFVGMGKLGFPCALAAAWKGHDVRGFDESLAPYDTLAARRYPHREVLAQELLEHTTLTMSVRLSDLVAHSEIVFVAVQTPHGPEYEGLTRMPKERADFDYTALRAAVRAVALEARAQKKPTTIVVISTCLPRTCKREIYPLLNEYTGFVYNPFFIAMGTTIADYLKPEFVLLGYDKDVDRVDSLDRVQAFYRSIHDTRHDVPVSQAIPHTVMPVIDAECTKVAYNTFIGSKIVLANAWMEICHRLGGNVDNVTNALALATERVVSPKYMRGGMGDGGGCHPRDQIALAWLADDLGLSCDPFGAMVAHRESQTEFLADLIDSVAKRTQLPVVLFGKAYKKGTDLTYGSPAILLKNVLDEFGVPCKHYDPHVDGVPMHEVYGGTGAPAICAVISTDHDEFFPLELAAGSVIIDPWGKHPDVDGVEVIRVGRAARAA
jgi:UDPglucose 6-dehydrogenase